MHSKLFRSSSCAKVGARTKKLEGGGGEKIFPLSTQAKKQTDSKLLTTSLKIKTLTVSPRSPRFPGAPAVPSWPCLRQNDNYIKKQAQASSINKYNRWLFTCRTQKVQNSRAANNNWSSDNRLWCPGKVQGGIYHGYLVPLFANELYKSETFNNKKEETGAFASYCRYSEVHFCQVFLVMAFLRL